MTNLPVIHPYTIFLLVVGTPFLLVPMIGVPILIVAALIEVWYIATKCQHRRELSEREREQRARAWKSL